MKLKGSVLVGQYADGQHAHAPIVLTPEQVVERGMQQLKQKGFKMTPKREQILHLFAKEERYLTAKYIHEYLQQDYPTMSYNTTYRNIYDFVEAGLLEMTDFNKEQWFRISCWQCDHEHHHHHFICTLCGRTLQLDACPMQYVRTDLSKVRVESHRFEVFGTCGECIAKEEQ